MFCGPALTIYRVMITFAIAVFIAGEFFVIGVILAIWAVVAMAVVPVVKGIRHLLESPTLRVQRRRAIAITAGVMAASFVFLFVVPMPFRSNAEGVIWFSDESIVRAGKNGFVGELMAAPGSRVRQGGALCRGHDSE